MIESFIEFLEKHLVFFVKVEVWDIDFSKPWQKTILTKSRLLFIGMIYEGVISIITVTGPIIASIAFRNKDISILLIYFFLSAVAMVFGWYLNTFFVRYNKNLPFSFLVGANKYFLKIDPNFHSTKNTGELISKVQRCAEAISSIINTFACGLLPISISLITTIVSFLVVDIFIGIVLSGLMILIVFLAMKLITSIDIYFEKQIIPIGDQVKSFEIENLNQTSYIRSIFATDIQHKKYLHKAKELYQIKSVGHNVWELIIALITLLYYLVSAVITALLFWAFYNGSLDAVTGLALLSSFFLGTRGIFQFGNIAKDINKDSFRIKDTFTFIRNYGQQTFPVLEEDLDKLT